MPSIIAPHMSNREKQRLKRKEKQRLLRKVRNQSAWDTLRGDPVRCHVLGDDESGLIILNMVFAQRNDTQAVITFKIDQWCTGLSDVFGRTNLSELELSETLSSYAGSARNCTAEEARAMIAGGIRFASQNRFRLPEDWQKFSRIAGVTRWSDADLSAFGKDGKLVYIGDLSELEELYLGDVDELMERDDFAFVGEVGDEEFTSEQAEALAEGITRASEIFAKHAAPMTTNVRQWLEARGEHPHVLLEKVGARFLFSIAMALSQMDEIDRDILATHTEAGLQLFIEDAGGPEDQREASAAVGQFVYALQETRATQDWANAAILALQSPEIDTLSARAKSILAR